MLVEEELVHIASAFVAVGKYAANPESSPEGWDFVSANFNAVMQSYLGGIENASTPQEAEFCAFLAGAYWGAVCAAEGVRP